MFPLLILFSLWDGLCAPPQAPAQTPPLLSIGIVTDVHYSNLREPANNRYYGASKRKLEEAVARFNACKVDLVVSLGDLIDSDAESYADIAPVLATSTAPVLKIAGNHDFLVPYDERKQREAMRTMGMGPRYFSRVMNGCRLLFLDANDVAVYAHSEGSPRHAEAAAVLSSLEEEGAANARHYNGALGREQLAWLARELDEASAAGERAICFCHMPVLPLLGRYLLWNNLEVAALIGRHPAAKAFLAGHHHPGGYGVYEKVHCVTFQGMIEGLENHFAILDLYPDRLVIRGFGSEVSRTLIYLK